MLIWKQGLKPETDSIAIRYRIFPLVFSKPYSHKALPLREPDVRGGINPFLYSGDEIKDDLFQLKGLSKQGSISRGISFGNNQDLSVNSNLNLQLSGQISDNVNVLAAITDNNIPIQPQGNTQQLQDFDQIYIQLFNEQYKLIAGDFQLRSPQSYYMSYFKKAQGATASGQFNPGKHSKSLLTLTASGAISRGKFSRNIIQGVEGNQGPYRLTGADNELFIIVLSGTERVFIDGQLLIRGQENDYVIDYNTSELTFTAKRLITKDKRIIVEFQYSDKNYARSLIQTGGEFGNEHLKLRFNVYSEQDSKNQPLQQQLSDQQKFILEEAGDSLTKAVSSTIEKTGFTNDQVRYRIVDTLGYDSVLLYSTSADNGLYRASFSNVGQGKGNYIQIKSIANGKVFQWLAPDTINGLPVKKGSYEPLTLLVAPRQQQMAVVSGELKLSATTKAVFELAGSNRDYNTFSTTDDRDNQGYAALFIIENRKPLLKNDTSWKLVSSAGYEQIHKQFTFIERFRPVEFDRDWNLRSLVLIQNQHIPKLSLGIEKNNVGSTTYQFSSYISESEFAGYRNSLVSLLNTKNWNLDFNGSYLLSKGSLLNTDYLRNKGRIAKKFSALTVGLRDDYEKNLFRYPANDSLLANSYQWLEWEAFIGNADSATNKYQLSYTWRKDYATKTILPERTRQLNEATYAQWWTFSYDIIKNPKSTLRGKSTYRTLTITDSTITSHKPDNTILNRVEYMVKLLKGTVISTSFYEIGSGLEVKKEYSFIEVPAGQGAYAWNDYNKNGIKELDEFEIAVFSDQARHIRVFTPTSNYIKTYSNQFGQQLTLQPSAIWSAKADMRKFISRFSEQLAWRSERKTQTKDFETAYNPFISPVGDTNLVTLNSSFRNTLFFNRTDPVVGFDITYQEQHSKLLLTSGYESRNQVFNEFNLRWNASRQWGAQFSGTQGFKSSIAEFFSRRNYAIDYYKAEPKLIFQGSATFRTSLSYTYMPKTNRAEYGGETALHQKIAAEVKVNWTGKGSLLCNAGFILIDYTTTLNTPLAFEMLEGLQPGRNYIWSGSYQHTLANNLQLNISYNGRKSETSKVIHTGGVQVRAFF